MPYFAHAEYRSGISETSCRSSEITRASEKSLRTAKTGADQAVQGCPSRARIAMPNFCPKDMACLPHHEIQPN